MNRFDHEKTRQLRKDCRFLLYDCIFVGVQYTVVRLLLLWHVFSMIMPPKKWKQQNFRISSGRKNSSGDFLDVQYSQWHQCIVVCIVSTLFSKCEGEQGRNNF